MGTSILAQAIKSIAEFFASIGYGSASMGGLHQPKEPERPIK